MSTPAPRVYKAHRERVCPCLSAFYAHADKAGLEAVIAAHALQRKLHGQLQKEVFRKGCLALVKPNFRDGRFPDFRSAK